MYKDRESDNVQVVSMTREGNKVVCVPIYFCGKEQKVSGANLLLP